MGFHPSVGRGAFTAEAQGAQRGAQRVEWHSSLCASPGVLCVSAVNESLSTLSL